jgi:hypothetical protein
MAYTCTREVAMSTNDLNIRRTEDGHFILVHKDPIHQVEKEQFRSSDLGEVMERLLDGIDQASISKAQARDYGPVVEILQDLYRGHPCYEREGFPSGWMDPLELYGCTRDELIRNPIDLAHERKKLAGLVFEKGPEWVWRNRLRLLAERISASSTDGMQAANIEVS